MQLLDFSRLFNYYNEVMVDHPEYQIGVSISNFGIDRIVQI